MRRAFLLAAALAIPVSGASVALTGGQAGAATEIVCTTITGNVSSTLVVSGCTGGATGGSSLPFAATALAGGGTIDWSITPHSTTIAAPKLKSTSAKKCPGYVKHGANNPSAEKVTGKVTADVGDGIKVPGKFKGEVCISSTGAVSALKPVTAS